MACTHYRRGCDVLAPCCEQFYACRFCHDAEKWEGEADPKRRHQLDRKAVKQVKCRDCQTIQSPQQNCESCGKCLGAYFCPICVFFDDDLNKQIYHCAGCGICRVGPQAQFFHCQTCNACLAISQQATHTCLPDVLRSNCAVCQEDLFTSRTSPVAFRCGHYLHKNCQKQFFRSGSITCPLCGKTVVDLADHFQQLDQEIESTPMPEELQNIKLQVLCKDCQQKSEVAYHFYGLKCGACGSYNTTRT
jgi:RING finger/CHY zinc finger protein 1